MGHFIDLYSSYWNGNMVGFIVDVALFILVGLSIFLCMRKKKSLVFSIIALFSYLVLTILTFTFELKFAPIFIVVGCLVIILSKNSYAVISKDNSVSKQVIGSSEGKKSTSITVDAKEKLIDDLVETVLYFSSKKMGALITIERYQSLNHYAEKAIIIDAKVTPELLKTIFYVGTDLHDGATIIKGDRVYCAAAWYSSRERTDLPATIGSRHRAAISISEESDAFTLVCSEETGEIKSTFDRCISEPLTEEEIRVALNEYILIKGDNE